MMNYTVESLLEDAIFLVGDGYSVLLQKNILVYKHAPEPCFGDLFSLKQEKEKKRKEKDDKICIGTFQRSLYEHEAVQLGVQLKMTQEVVIFFFFFFLACLKEFEGCCLFDLILFIFLLGTYTTLLKKLKHQLLPGYIVHYCSRGKLDSR